MKDRIFVSKSRSGGGGNFFLVFLMLLGVFVLGVFVGTKISSFNIKIVKEEVRGGMVSDQTGIGGPQNTVNATRNDDQKVVNESNPAVTPEVSPEPPKVTEFTLQLAAFKGAEKAQELVDGLKEKGYYAYVIPVRNSKGEAWHLIRMGKFKTREEAQNFAALFREREKMDALVKEVEQDVLLKEFGQ